MIQFRTPTDVQVDTAKLQALVSALPTNPMGGWFDLPETYDRAELAAIQAAATKIQQTSEYLVCIGIGGSYLGHRALSEALRPTSGVKLLYAGNSLSPAAYADLFATLGDHDFSINVISKSGTTTEPAVAFRLLKAKLYAKYGDAAKARIYATTDAAHGALHDEAVAEGYQRFIVPDNIGGRYSVLSAVGLLPLAAAGVDIEALLAGAAAERQTLISALKTATPSAAPSAPETAPETASETTAKPAPAPQSLADLPVLRYASLRAQLFAQGTDLEVLATFEPHFQQFTEWWKQLFGESEGKQHQGIFPASVVYTTDLHSLGQYLQEGRRNIFETMLEFATPPASELTVPQTNDNLDGLQYLEGKTLTELNQKALEATVTAHRDGGIPVAELIAPDQSTQSLGALVFFFETACALSAQLAGVNPFDQPGVEAYKNNMFHLLGKPGF